MDVALWSRVPTCILLISCGVPQLAMSELTITVTGLPDEQVTLSPLSTLDIQDAERLADPQRRLLPFVVTVKNESERYYCIPRSVDGHRWTRQDHCLKQ